MTLRAVARLTAIAILTASFVLAAHLPADAATTPANTSAPRPVKKAVKRSPAGHVWAQSDGAAVADPSTGRASRDPWRDARAMADRGQPDSAIAVLRGVLARDPLDFGLRWLEAGILGEAGRHAESVALYDRLAAEFPDRAAELLSDRAQQRLEAGDARGAAEDLNAWLSDHPGDSYARLRLGRALIGCDDLHGALAAFDGLLLREPDHQEAALERARVLGWLGRHGEAIASYEAVLEREPGLASAELGLARNESWNGLNRRASRRLEALVEREPAEAEAWKALALARYWDGDPDGAVEALARHEVLAPGDAEATALLVRIARERGPRAELAHESSDDSDGLAVRSPMVEVSWPLASGTTASLMWRQQSAEDGGGSSGLKEWGAGLRRTWSPMWAAYARGAVTTWDAGSGARRGGELGVIMRPADRVRLEAVTAREPVITRLAMQENVSMLQWALAADWEATPRLLLSANGRAGSYSDGNRSERTAFAARWKLRDDARWEVGARLSLDQLNVHQDLDHGYYDPDFYREWGPGLDLAMRPGPRWRLAASVRTGWQSEKGASTDPYYGIEGGIEWMPGPDWTLALAGGRGDSNLQSASGYQRGWWRLGLVRAF